MKTAEQITAETVSNLNNDLAYRNPQEFILEEGNVILPIYWSEDNKGNINYDIESIREQFESLMSALEKHNDNSDFDWDNF
jgi:hypothetical protein